MLSFSRRRRKVVFFAIAIVLVFCSGTLQAQGKPAQAPDLKIGFLMDSLKIERGQTELDAFEKRAKELGAQVLVETAEGDDELQLQQAQKLLNAGVKTLVLVPHDAEKAVRIVKAANAKKVPVLCYERLIRNADVDAFVGVDVTTIGYLQARSIYQLAPKGK